VNTPPRRGPIALATAKTAANDPNNIGLSSSRVTSAMMDKTVVKILSNPKSVTYHHTTAIRITYPAAPDPATALPKIKKFIDGATAQNSEPISNKTIEAR